MTNTLVDWFASAQAWLFQAVVQPLMFHAGFSEYLEDAFDGTEWFLIGVCELVVLFLILRPLEAVIPVHAFTDRRARRTDFIYTVLYRLGAFSMLVFFLVDPLMAKVTELLHLQGLNPFNLENLLPGFTDQPLITFLMYLLVLDLCEYWYHRAQHNVGWLWGLHSLHHSQQNMNLWSDDRNHLLDGLIHDVMLALVALAIGVEPTQYVLLVSITRMLQSLQHANVRIHFGRLGDVIVVSPRFHRWHHAIGIGHESKGRGTLGGHNFGVLFAFWDILFRSAWFGKTFELTGVRDQLPTASRPARDYGQGFWSQQWLGLKRMVEFARRSSR
ncbi:Fatty acid hydroxylase superfamily protein [Collimonas sp. OK307]|uniref:sterol desaturase family protein n=1 Tax=Collimonas sp. OK307 TaxID=1801620 RepID=UPI0008ED0374|nr:sterol desaturase family protein [Collimonas sp. OK307]SFI14521.1 Fatty acid hydroxylase superfamily protein [Collimonas sp. OK307]